MSKIPLSEEDLLTIVKNPNVESASPVSVKFTFAFKQKAYDLPGKRRTRYLPRLDSMLMHWATIEYAVFSTT